MTNRFHLAIQAGDLESAIYFYCDVLGCTRGKAEFKYPDAWADINFWGNELTLHATDPNKKKNGEAPKHFEKNQDFPRIRPSRLGALSDDPGYPPGDIPP